MIFGFDLDGVLYPWHYVAWEWYRDLTNDEGMDFYDFWKYPDGWVANNEGSYVVEAMVKNKKNYTKSPMSHYVREAVYNIANKYADKIYYITGRPTHVKDITRKYLMDSRMPQAENLYFSDENGGKLEIIKELGCDYYAEDRPKYLEILPEVTKVFAVVAPYNTYKKWDAYVVHHVMEIADILEKINGT